MTNTENAISETINPFQKIEKISNLVLNRIKNSSLAAPGSELPL